MDLDDWDELGPPELRKVPQGHPRLRIAAAVAGGVVGVALLAGLVVWAANRPSAQQPAPAPAPVTTQSGNVTESFVVTASGGATESSVPSTAAPAPTGPSVVHQFERAAKVAYRQDGALWVADESGANARKLVASASGAFSLSPDGGAIAVVDGATKTLAVVDVASAKVTTVGSSDARAAVWAPSSTWLAYSDGTSVLRVDRSGKRARTLGKGTHVSIGPDALAYAYASGTSIVYVDAEGKQHAIALKARVDDLALGVDRVYYALGGPSRASVALHARGLDGGNDITLAGAPADSEAGRYDELALSPDGAWLAYAAAGDDMHSRIRAIRTDGTRDSALSLRHDDYLLRWSADGSRVFFIDGNVLQGDATQLMSIRPDGTQRATVRKGAGM